MERGARKRVILALYAVWVAAVLLSSVPTLAEMGTRMLVGDGEYEYHPRFTPTQDEKEHYPQNRVPSCLEPETTTKDDGQRRQDGDPDAHVERGDSSVCQANEKKDDSRGTDQRI